MACRDPLSRLGRVDVWLGHEGARERGLDSGTPVVVPVGDPDRPGTTHNWAALRAVGDPVAGEVLYLGAARGRTRHRDRDHRVRLIGTVHRDGRVGAGIGSGRLVGRVWNRMVCTLPPLPWAEIAVVRTRTRWPRAYALPGGVVVGPDVDLDRPAGALLYLIHELTHQWIGALVRRPPTMEAVDAMEAHVDAVAGAFVVSELPALAPAYDRLFGAYRRTAGWQGRAEVIGRLRRDPPGELIRRTAEQLRDCGPSSAGRLPYRPLDRGV